MDWDRRGATYTFYAPAEVAEVAEAVNVVFEQWQKTSERAFVGGRRVEMNFEHTFERQVQWSANDLAGAAAENWASYQGYSRWVNAVYYYTFSVTLEPIGAQTKVTTSTVEAIDPRRTAVKNHQSCKLPSLWSEVGDLGPSLERLL